MTLLFTGPPDIPLQSKFPNLGSPLGRDDPRFDLDPRFRSSFGEGFDAAVEAMRASDTEPARIINLSRAVENRRKIAEDAAGVALDEAIEPFRQQARDTLPGDPTAPFGIDEKDLDANRGVDEEAFRLFVETLPADVRAQLPFGKDLAEAGKKIGMERFLAIQQTLKRSTGFSAGAGVFLGTLAGATLFSPIALMSILAGAPLANAVARGFLARGLFLRSATAAGVEAAIGAGAEIPIQVIVQDYRNEIGLESGFDLALQNIILVGLFSGTLGGAGIGLRNVVKRALGDITSQGLEVPHALARFIRKEDGTPITDLTNAQLVEFMDEIALRTGSLRLTGDEKAARQAIDLLAVLEETRPRPDMSVRDHVRNLDETARSVESRERVDPHATPTQPVGEQVNLVTPSTSRLGATIEVAAALKGTKVINDNGEPLVVYHGTFTEFDSFRAGSHFGDQTSANVRLQQVEKSGGAKDIEGAAARIIPARLSIKNPLRIEDSGGSFDGFDLLAQVRKAGAITQKQSDKIAGTKISPELVQRALFDHLEKRGFDGLVYRNAIEGSSDSWIIFHPEQVKPALRASAPTPPREGVEGVFGTKVVDENGEPLLVHHGTTADFKDTEFSLRESAKNNALGEGFFFTPEARAAQEAANRSFSNRVVRPLRKKWIALKDAGKTKEAKKAKAAYEKARDEHNEARESGVATGRIVSAHLRIENPFIIDISNPKSIKDAERLISDEGGTLVVFPTDEVEIEGLKNIREMLIARGHDGIIVKGSSGRIREVVAFSPNQIKRAAPTPPREGESTLNAKESIADTTDTATPAREELSPEDADAATERLENEFDQTEIAEVTGQNVHDFVDEQHSIVRELRDNDTHKQVLISDAHQSFLERRQAELSSETRIFDQTGITPPRVLRDVTTVAARILPEDVNVRLVQEVQEAHGLRFQTIPSTLEGGAPMLARVVAGVKEIISKRRPSTGEAARPAVYSFRENIIITAGRQDVDGVVEFRIFERIKGVDIASAKKTSSALGRELGFVNLIERPDGRWDVAFMSVEVAFRGDPRGSFALIGGLAAAQKHIGEPILPSGTLTRDGFNNLKKIFPEVAAWWRKDPNNSHPDAFILSPKQLIRSRDIKLQALKFYQRRLAELQRGEGSFDEIVRREQIGTVLHGARNIEPQIKKLNEAIDALPAEAKTTAAIQRQFSIDEIGRFQGAWDAQTSTVMLAAGALDPVHVLRHETIHALRSMGLLTKDEWALLAESARKFGWIKKHGIEERYAQESGDVTISREDFLLEEAIAEEFAQWRAGGLKVNKKTEKLFKKILKVLKDIAEKLRGNNINDFRDVFEAIDSGRVARRPRPSRPRPAADVAAPAAPKFTTRQDVSAFLLGKGGLRSKNNEFSGIHVPKFLLRKNGMTPDQAREALVEGGFISDTSGSNRPDDTAPDDALQIIDSALRGERIVAVEDFSDEFAFREDARVIKENEVFAAQRETFIENLDPDDRVAFESLTDPSQIEIILRHEVDTVAGPTDATGLIEQFAQTESRFGQPDIRGGVSDVTVPGFEVVSLAEYKRGLALAHDAGELELTPVQGTIKKSDVPSVEDSRTIHGGETFHTIKPIGERGQALKERIVRGIPELDNDGIERTPSAEFDRQRSGGFDEELRTNVEEIRGMVERGEEFEIQKLAKDFTDEEKAEFAEFLDPPARLLDDADAHEADKAQMQQCLTASGEATE